MAMLIFFFMYGLNVLVVPYNGNIISLRVHLKKCLNEITSLKMLDLAFLSFQNMTNVWPQRWFPYNLFLNPFPDSLNSIDKGNIVLSYNHNKTKTSGLHQIVDNKHAAR